MTSQITPTFGSAAIKVVTTPAEFTKAVAEHSRLSSEQPVVFRTEDWAHLALSHAYAGADIDPGAWLGALVGSAVADKIVHLEIIVHYAEVEDEEEENDWLEEDDPPPSLQPWLTQACPNLLSLTVKGFVGIRDLLKTGHAKLEELSIGRHLRKDGSVADDPQDQNQDDRWLEDLERVKTFPALGLLRLLGAEFIDEDEFDIYCPNSTMMAWRPYCDFFVESRKWTVEDGSGTEWQVGWGQSEEERLDQKMMDFDADVEKDADYRRIQRTVLWSEGEFRERTHEVMERHWRWKCPDEAVPFGVWEGIYEASTLDRDGNQRGSDWKVSDLCENCCRPPRSETFFLERRGG